MIEQITLGQISSVIIFIVSLGTALFKIKSWISTPIDKLNSSIAANKKSIEETWVKIEKSQQDDAESISLLKAGLQCVLRNELFKLKNDYIYRQKYATDEQKDHWIDIYSKYESLGENGPMAVANEKVLALPAEPITKTKKILNED